MTSLDHARAKEIFVAACERPEEERRSFLESTCEGNPELLREVEDLLQFYEPAPPERIGKYRLVRHIAEGGMGEVWEAEQEEPVRRRVALKLIRAGMDTRQVVARFESERQALALMDHPNVAHVFDAGVSENGRPFFVMEYLEGAPITTHCDRMRLTLPERMEILLAVCDGVQHAHQKGIIHRDIKPSNILVQTVDGRPLPKVIDFGVAKARGGGLRAGATATADGVLVGTPGYMSPEQAGTSAIDVDTRADVYSLGVLIYEVLVGVGPLDNSSSAEESLEEVLRRIREEEPSKPSSRVITLGDAAGEVEKRRNTPVATLRRQLRGDLDWIVMKALDKDRERRYPSAASLAADLRRYLRDEAVQAGPPSVVYRARKFVRRHRAGVAAAVVATVALALGLLGATVGLVRAQHEAETAQRVADLLLGTFDELNPNATGGVATAEAILERGAEEIAAELEDEPIVQASLFASMGQAYLALGRFPQAREVLERAVSLRREHLGTDDPQTLMAMNQFGEILWQLGEHDLSQTVLTETLATLRRVLGSDHPSVGRTLLNLGVVHLRNQNLDSAEALIEEALEISRATHGPIHIDVATDIFWLSEIEVRRSDLVAAWTHARRSREIVEALSGPQHPYMGWPLFQLGRLHQITGDPDSAKVYYQRSLDLQERTLGPGHPFLAYPLNALGMLLITEGDYGAARALIERAQGINEAAFGRDHPFVAQILNELGNVLRMTGDLEGARAAHRRALGIVEDAPSIVPAEMRRTLEFLSRVEEAAGNVEEAARLLARADSIAAAESR